MKISEPLDTNVSISVSIPFSVIIIIPNELLKELL